MIKSLLVNIRGRVAKLFREEGYEEHMIRRVLKDNYRVTSVLIDSTGMMGTVTIMSDSALEGEEMDTLCDRILKEASLEGIDFRVTDREGNIKQIIIATGGIKCGRQVI